MAGTELSVRTCSGLLFLLFSFFSGGGVDEWAVCHEVSAILSHFVPVVLFMVEL